ncbi:cation:proton antiporter [Sulfurovum sp. XTW-4]|uniref:Cation:proton antiporter n=1 Tax=Sulfurovum xiamenensis TaxID=3019066 RepID=A0ABT7QRA9_9BACT|nr:cation:proton antiporter [Sulfurovum xiamenensis]MDM5263317.1 cation:proton antiporter [Sulfurovum xiamenensis]
MDVHNFFLILFLILVTARILGELFARLGIPSVLGELSAGILLGVSGFGLVEVNDVLKILAEIGILLLLFEIGLDTDIARLKQAGGKAIIVALFGAVFPFTVSAFVAYYLFDLTLVVSLFIGGTLTATSIGITMRVLKDLQKEHSEVAQIVIGAAVLDDILGVIVLVFIYDYAITQTLSLTNTLNTTVFILLFFLLAPAFAHFISHFMRKFDEHKRVPGFIPTLIIALIALFAYMSHLFGAPEILGSFAAGIALSRRFILPFGMGLQHDEVFLEKVKMAITPIAQMFTPIFFVMVGLSMNLKVIDFTSVTFWSLAFVFLVIAIIGKYIGAFLLRDTSALKKALIGISMIPRGEVGLIFAEVGRVNGILDDQIYAVLIFVIIVTTIAPPFLLKWLFKYEVNGS